jgi:hypothetical protein
MADKLLIRLFDVGLGDCIYVRIPKAHKDGRDFHLLIDCGSLSGGGYLSDAMTALKPLLPEVAGKRHIDLLVITHEHKDHMTGFGLDLWKGLSFGAIWMSAAMDLNHPESTRAKKLHTFAVAAMTQALRLNLALGPELAELASVMAANEDAMQNLRKTLPMASGIMPVYVHADSSKQDLDLPLKGASLNVLKAEQAEDEQSQVAKIAGGTGAILASGIVESAEDAQKSGPSPVQSVSAVERRRAKKRPAAALCGSRPD